MRLNLCFLSPTRVHKPNGTSIGSAVSAQLTAESPLYTLQRAVPSPLKIAASHGVSGPTSNTCFPWPTQVLNPNGISIGSAVFAWLTSVTPDRWTDRPRYSVGNNRPHLRRPYVALRCGLIITKELKQKPLSAEDLIHVLDCEGTKGYQRNVCWLFQRSISAGGYHSLCRNDSIKCLNLNFSTQNRKRIQLQNLNSLRNKSYLSFHGPCSQSFVSFKTE